MKRSEVAMIILVASLSMLLTFTLAQSLLGEKIKQSVKVEQAEEISEDIVQPAKRTFNSSAINPTVEVCVETNQSSGTSEDDSSDQCTGSSEAAEGAEASPSNETLPPDSAAPQDAQNTN
ncbi:MAG: hypothetical protein UY35_C0004G0041 [Candidatus Saccharibacteria bacterium GW2011_GWC2_48_9]|nr:MAG: hypothetical protein UY35_C0004G0041 [Candidatus Saccharibacteria bacterium GW2011_GWC2_48_9]HCH34795.1 hypothetical protein [Candidatus Saccharibacteria bacterium]